MNAALLTALCLGLQHPVVGVEIGMTSNLVQSRDPFSSYAPSQAVRALREQICLQSYVQITAASLAEDKELEESHRRISAAAYYGTLHPLEREWEAAKVWMLSPSRKAQWGSVFSTPHLTPRLARVGDPADRSIYDITAAGLTRRYRLYGSLPSMPSAEGSDPVSELRQAKTKVYHLHRAFSSTVWPADPSPKEVEAVLAMIHLNEYQDDVRKVKSLLSAEERAEWESVMESYTAASRAVNRLSSTPPAEDRTRVQTPLQGIDSTL